MSDNLFPLPPISPLNGGQFGSSAPTLVGRGIYQPAPVLVDVDFETGREVPVAGAGQILPEPVPERRVPEPLQPARAVRLIGYPSGPGTPAARREPESSPADPLAALQAVSQPLAPQQRVTFDVPGYGPIEAFYHKVTRKDDFIILAYDTGFTGPRSFPRHSAQQLAMHIFGTDQLFLIETTGRVWEEDGVERCMLNIKKEGSYNAYRENEITESDVQVPLPPEEVFDDARETRSDCSGGDSPGEIAQMF
jgi:hypothetical protein